MVGVTFGLAIEKDSSEMEFNDGFREVFLVKKDDQGRCYHISSSTEFEINVNSEEWILPGDTFDKRFRLLTAHEMHTLFTDDSHVTQLLHPSPYNMIHVEYKGWSAKGSLLRMMHKGDGEDIQARLYCVSFADKQQVGRGNCPLIVVAIRAGNGRQQRNLYKIKAPIDLGKAKALDVWFDRRSSQSAREEIKNLHLLETDNAADAQLDSAKDILALFYLRKGTVHPASEATDKIANVDDVIPDFKSALLCAGTISTLLATIAATAYFVVGLAFAQVDELKENGAFYEFAQKPTFVAFLLFLGVGLFSSLSCIVFVAYGILNLGGPTSNSNHGFSFSEHNSMDLSNYKRKYLQYAPGSFKGEATPVLQVDYNWRNRRLDGLWVMTCWAGFMMILAVNSILIASMLGGFIVLYAVNPYACIGFITIAVFFIVGIFVVFAAGHQAYYDRHHLSFWRSLLEVTLGNLLYVALPSMLHFAKTKTDK